MFIVKIVVNFNFFFFGILVRDRFSTSTFEQFIYITTYSVHKANKYIIWTICQQFNIRYVYEGRKNYKFTISNIGFRLRGNQIAYFGYTHRNFLFYMILTKHF